MKRVKRMGRRTRSIVLGARAVEEIAKMEPRAACWPEHQGVIGVRDRDKHIDRRSRVRPAPGDLRPPMPGDLVPIVRVRRPARAGGLPAARHRARFPRSRFPNVACERCAALPQHASCAEINALLPRGDSPHWPRVS